MLRYALPGVDDIEEDDIDIDDLINQEEESDGEEERKAGEKPKKKLAWDEELLIKMLTEVGDEGLGEGEDEEEPSFM